MSTKIPQILERKVHMTTIYTLIYATFIPASLSVCVYVCIYVYIYMHPEDVCMNQNIVLLATFSMVSVIVYLC